MHMRHKQPALMLTAVLAGSMLAIPASAIEPATFQGAITGKVMNQGGTPQLGASVYLYNKFDRMLARVLTDVNGAFQFPSLMPDVYSVRVTLSSFVPALKEGISIQAGTQSFLAISLSGLVSSIELVYQSSGQRAWMNDDWKWVLRSASSTRPVLRMLPGVNIDPVKRPHAPSGMFTDTKGLLRVSAGGGAAAAAAGNQTDLGTAFALATSLFGSHHLQVSGNLGYASAVGMPTAGFRTGFTPSFGGEAGPEVNVTMRQVFLPTRVGSAIALHHNDGIPALQSLALSFSDSREIADGAEITYGAILESVSFLTRLNYASPYARLRIGSEQKGQLEIAFSSGVPATELIDGGPGAEAGMNQSLNALSMFPRVSLRGGQAHVQRAENMEVGYRRKAGSREYAVSAWRESVRNAAFTAASPAGFYRASELLPDLGSTSYVFNAGDFQRTGYTATVTQTLAEALSATIAYGYAGGLTSATPQLATPDPNELRGALQKSMRHAWTARVSGTAPHSGTKYTASYQRTDRRTLQPVHLALTQRNTFEPGLNISIRQPLPGGVGMLGGKLEASAELRNMLAEGYLPFNTANGQFILISTPRAVRGGLSLIF
jgi:hypothetical protein